MQNHKLLLGIVLAAAGAGAAALGVPGQAQEAGKKGAPAAQKSDPRSNQILMRDKLTFANKALEGLSVEDFGKVVESAEMMRLISKAAGWHVIDSDEYRRLSKDFQEQAADLERHARDKNLDAASLDYMRITHSCVQCHKYMRQVKKGKR